MGRRSLLYHTFNFGLSAALVLVGWAPTLVPGAFGLSLADALEGIERPAIGVRPTRIGLRQLLVGVGFVAIMVLAYLV